MNTYRIENTFSGQVFGDYEGETPEQAVQAMLDDAGYDGPASPDIEAVRLISEAEAIELAESLKAPGSLAHAVAWKAFGTWTVGLFCGESHGQVIDQISDLVGEENIEATRFC